MKMIICIKVSLCYSAVRGLIISERAQNVYAFRCT